jgi:type VI secretion system secreted protein Hcp
VAAITYVGIGSPLQLLRRMDLKGWTRIGALVFVCAFLLALPSAASANIFLELDGIQGESNAVGFENQIEIGSLQLGVGRGAKEANFSEVTLTKQLDKSSPELMLRAANGTTIPSATLRFTTTGQEKVVVYLRYCLTGVRIAGFSQSSGGDRPNESLSLSYATIVQSYTQGSETGGAGTVFATGWDLLKNLQITPAVCNN